MVNEHQISMLCSQAEYLVVYLALRPVYWLTTIHFISTLKYKMCMSLIRVSALTFLGHNNERRS